MSKKYKKTWKYLNYIKKMLISAWKITACVLISKIASLICVPVGITSFAVGIKIFAVTAGTKKFRSTIKNFKKRSIVK